MSEWLNPMRVKSEIVEVGNLLWRRLSLSVARD